jgi:hypothetical protein
MAPLPRHALDAAITQLEPGPTPEAPRARWVVKKIVADLRAEAELALLDEGPRDAVDLFVYVIDRAPRRLAAIGIAATEDEIQAAFDDQEPFSWPDVDTDELSTEKLRQIGNEAPPEAGVRDVPEAAIRQLRQDLSHIWKRLDRIVEQSGTGRLPSAVRRRRASPPSIRTRGRSRAMRPGTHPHQGSRRTTGSGTTSSGEDDPGDEPPPGLALRRRFPQPNRPAGVGR